MPFAAPATAGAEETFMPLVPSPFRPVIDPTAAITGPWCALVTGRTVAAPATSTMAWSLAILLPAFEVLPPQRDPSAPRACRVHRVNDDAGAR